MEEERLVVKMLFGSHVYGTSTPQSDTDYKSIYIPSGRDILLGQMPKTSRSHNTQADPDGKNGPDDVDHESFTLMGYLKLLSQGQTVATDMLFVPRKHVVGEQDVIWSLIQGNSFRLLSKNMKGFLGYCKTQANKYGIKGSRMGDARAIVEVLGSFQPHLKVGDHAGFFESFVADREHSEIVEIEQPHDRPAMKHLSVCNRKVPYTSTIKHALEVYGKLFEQYGERTRAAEKNEGVDWKALMHAVRIGQQGLELLETGNVIFPRPNATQLLNIRKGKYDYGWVAEEIEQLLVALEEASRYSDLPDTPDYDFIEEIVLAAHEGQIV